jgi:hypothetical protein
MRSGRVGAWGHCGRSGNLYSSTSIRAAWCTAQAHAVAFFSSRQHASGHPTRLLRPAWLRRRHLRSTRLGGECPVTCTRPSPSTAALPCLLLKLPGRREFPSALRLQHHFHSAFEQTALETFWLLDTVILAIGVIENFSVFAFDPPMPQQCMVDIHSKPCAWRLPL